MDPQTIRNWIHEGRLIAAHPSPRVYRIPEPALQRLLSPTAPKVHRELIQPAVSWEEGLRAYEDHFHLSTQEMLREQRAGVLPVFDKPDDETLFGMWTGAAYLAVAAGLVQVEDALPVTSAT